jgi:hypothetical protein
LLFVVRFPPDPVPKNPHRHPTSRETCEQRNKKAAAQF